MLIEPQPLLVDLTEAGKLLGCGRTTLYELIASGELEAVTVGKRLRRFPRQAIDDYVERIRQQAKSTD